MTTTREQTLFWILRIATGLCFIGHGMFGVITKAEWLPFFALVGMGPDTAYAVMPLVGLLDIAMGVSVLFAPTRAVLLYMTVWAVWTATLRPLTGQPIFELLERAGNFGAPLALLFLYGIREPLKRWLTPASIPGDWMSREKLVWRTLTVSTALLLVGHSGLTMYQNPLLVEHAAFVGLDAATLLSIGAFEIALAVAVLVAPRPAVLIGVAAWKVGTELLFPLSGAPVWEFVERGGSYGLPLAMAVIASRRAVPVRVPSVPVAGVPAILVAAGLMLFARSSAAAQQHEHGPDRVALAPAGILDSLSRGGYVLACRHAATDHDQSDRGSARDLQRNLTARGEDDARSIGAAIRARGIPIGDVFANPMYRNQETATYAFGRMKVDSSLAGPNASKSLRALLGVPVARGTNRAIVARVGILSGAMSDKGVRNMEEGDCFVVRPLEDGDFKVLARLQVAHWR